MHRTHDPGTTNRTEGAHAANRHFVPEPTARYNAGIQYSRLIHRCCTSLDLETAFKEIKISQTLKKKCVTSAKLRSADAQHLRQGRRAHQHHQHLPILVTNKFPTWWQPNHCKNCILSCIHLPTKKQNEKLQRFVEHLNTTGQGHMYIIGVTISCIMH